MQPRALLAVIVAAAACGDDGGPDLPPLTDAKTLACPTPGALPFRLGTSGYQVPLNEQVVAANPRIKDEAGDTLGNPGGPMLSVYDPDDSTGAPHHYVGAKARTGADEGLYADPLPGERVSLWWFDTAADAWAELGTAETDAAGRYALEDIEPRALGEPVFALLDANASCDAHYDYLYPRGTKVIVADIDGTLTLDDNELLTQLVDESYQPKPMGAARALVDAWVAKGYVIVYMTARPHVYRLETRRWLTELGFPLGPVITTNSESQGFEYKALWVERIRETFGWEITAGYGNAQTDIDGYGMGGIPRAVTFIVGPLGGVEGTVAIPNLDFSEHIATYVAAQPDA